jgi:hypothetical protein
MMYLLHITHCTLTRPVFLRLLPGFKKVAQELPETRVQLQRDVRDIVKKYGPELGALYYDKSGDWEKQYVMRTNSDKDKGGDDHDDDRGAENKKDA